MPRAAGGKVKVAATTPAAAASTTGFILHMLKESRTSPKTIIVTLCGEEGKPYGFDKTGLRTTVWPSSVTCPECKAHPGVNAPRRTTSGVVE